MPTSTRGQSFSVSRPAGTFCSWPSSLSSNSPEASFKQSNVDFKPSSHTATSKVRVGSANNSCALCTKHFFAIILPMHFTLRVNQLLFARCASKIPQLLRVIRIHSTNVFHKDCWNHDALSRIHPSGWVQMHDVVQRGQAASRESLLQLLLMRPTSTRNWWQTRDISRQTTPEQGSFIAKTLTLDPAPVDNLNLPAHVGINMIQSRR